MTPKEKASELYLKHRSIIAEKQLASNFMLISEAEKLTKKSALISVNEIIKSLRKDLPIFELGKGFWQEVKKEIKDI